MSYLENFYSMPTVHLIITGKVQGVFYRATAKSVADNIGISGKVQNMQGGEVEIWASGTEEQLQRIITWCHEGSSGAHVDEVETAWTDDQSFEGFKIIRK